MYSHKIKKIKHLKAPDLKKQGGYTLIAIVLFMIVIGGIASGGLTQSTKSEHLAGNAIQRSRSFQAADGASKLAEDRIDKLIKRRFFADTTATGGMFSRNSRTSQWWRNDTAQGAHAVDNDAILGVVTPPRYSIEQVGQYLSDGGTGVVNLDIGGAEYGRLTTAGREILLFSVESHGKGSFDAVDTVIESTIAVSY